MTDEQEYSRIYKALEDAEKRIDDGFPATDVLIVLIHNGKTGTLVNIVSSDKSRELPYLMLARQIHKIMLPVFVQDFIHTMKLRSN